MDIASIAASAASAQRTQTANAIALEMVKIAKEQGDSLVALLESAADSGKARAAEVQGSAGLVDLTV